MRPLDPRLLRYASATRGYLAGTVALGVALAGLVVAQAVLLAGAITAVFLDGAGLADLAGTLWWLAAVVVARAAVAYGQEVAAARAAASAKSELRRRLYDTMLSLGPDRSPPTGAVSTLVTRGLDALDAYFGRYLPQLVLAGLVPAIVVLRLLPADLIATVTIALTLPLIPLFMVLVGLHTATANRRQFRLLGRLSHHFLDVVAGLPTLKVFGRASAQRTTIRQVSEQHRRLTVRTLRIAFLSSLVLELLATLSVALVAVGIGLRLVSGDLDLATALLVLILAPEAYAPLRQVGTNYHAAAEGLAAADEAFTVIESTGPTIGGSALVNAAAAELCFDRVRVDLPDRAAAALALSETIRPGEFVALTGPSGSGKSTALALLLGFRTPSTGTLTVDGVPVSTLDLGRWRASIAWVPQRPWLFAGTVAENIALGTGHRDVERGARLADAHDFITALPDGYATVLGDGGAGLSTGQRQRIALARAFARDAPILLLDEPTANLDMASAAHVMASIRELAVGRTVIVAAHRPELAALADRQIHLVPAVLEPVR